MSRLNYLELPVAQTGRSAAFYQSVFGWAFTDFGPSYAATTSGDTDVGLQADGAEKTAAALPVIEVADLTATLAAVEAGGGTITAPIFGFPGGHRFHFRDLDGHELAALTSDAREAVPDPIERWHAWMDARDPALLDALLADDVVFRSPAVHTPQHGRAITAKYLRAATLVLGAADFAYLGEWRADRSAVLEFRTVVDGLEVHGVDMIAWGDDGRITSFTVMIRPLKGLHAVVAAMGALLAA